MEAVESIIIFLGITDVFPGFIFDGSPGAQKQQGFWTEVFPFLGTFFGASLFGALFRLHSEGKSKQQDFQNKLVELLSSKVSGNGEEPAENSDTGEKQSGESTNNSIRADEALKALLYDKRARAGTKGFRWTRRIIAFGSLAVFFTILLGNSVYVPIENDGWSVLFGLVREGAHIEYKKIEGVLLHPQLLHLIAAITGLYFGPGVVKSGQ